MALTDDDIDRYKSELSNWGRWGADDQIGALNLIGPEQRRAAAALVRTGRAVGCARPLPTTPAADNPVPVAHHMIGTLTEGYGADYFAIASHGHATSHLDALCHIFWDGRVYNGYPADTVTARGAMQLGVHHLADGVQGRGVLLDVCRVKGLDWLERGYGVTVADLEAAESDHDVAVGTGDILLVRTGRWVDRAANGPWSHGQAAAGLHAECLPWLHERGVAMLGCDGVSDVIPSGFDRHRLPIHEVAIPAMGIHLLDNLDLDRLAGACVDERRWAFLLTVAPLVLTNGTASPVNPIATF
jgi:kynurenine formamidase